jgi:hypothetical protein
MIRPYSEEEEIFLEKLKRLKENNYDYNLNSAGDRSFLD